MSFLLLSPAHEAYVLNDLMYLITLIDTNKFIISLMNSKHK